MNLSDHVVLVPHNNKVPLTEVGVGLREQNWSFPKRLLRLNLVCSSLNLNQVSFDRFKLLLRVNLVCSNLLAQSCLFRRLLIKG